MGSSHSVSGFLSEGVVSHVAIDSLRPWEEVNLGTSYITILKQPVVSNNRQLTWFNTNCWFFVQFSSLILVWAACSVTYIVIALFTGLWEILAELIHRI